MNLNSNEIEQLKSAKRILENPSFLIRLTNAFGKPFESVYKLLPSRWQVIVANASKSAVTKALKIVTSNMDNTFYSKPKNSMHKLFATASGVAGGTFGIMSLPIELPITTAIILRSIADIARSKNFDINNPEIQLACLEVFALGGNSKSDDLSDSSYYLTRSALSSAITSANKYLLEGGMVKEGAPLLLNFISKISSRFGVVVSEQVAAKAIPVIGAVGGGSINLLFITHFQQIAEAHFTVKQLELKYGSEYVKTVYNNLET